MFTVGAAKTLVDLQLEGGRSSGGGGGGGSFGGGGIGGTGPALGSAQEAALVIQRRVGPYAIFLGFTQHLRLKGLLGSLAGRHPPFDAL